MTVNTASIRQLNEQVQQEALFLQDLLAEINKVMVGQQTLVERVLIALLADGHILLEGVPGLAKTLLIKTMAQAIQSDYSRIQFTPDLLPADLVGTQIYNPKNGEFTIHQGPLFANLILADEINRAPAKVQSALLEAMQERQVTIGNTTYHMEKLFLVLATQNPIEQEGTYPLPEAQVDRFMLKVMVDYPKPEEELAIIDRMTAIVQRDAPWSFGFYPKSFSLHHQWLTNVKPNLMANNTLKYRKLDPATRERLREKWNPPVLWPIGAAVMILAIGALPAIVIARRRERSAAR